jgi:hypothetical protein
MSTKTSRAYVCGICGKQRTAEQMIYSSHTGIHYCRPERGRGLCKRPRGGVRTSPLASADPSAVAPSPALPGQV